MDYYRNITAQRRLAGRRNRSIVNRLTFIAAIVALGMVIAVTITTGSILMLGVPVNMEKAS